MPKHDRQLYELGNLTSGLRYFADELAQMSPDDKLPETLRDGLIGMIEATDAKTRDIIAQGPARE